MVTEEYIASFDGTRLFTETFGEGDVPVVLCDGLGCDGFIWQHLTPAFRDKCRFYHFHYRGHGLSNEPAVENATTVRDLRSDLSAVMDHYGLDKALLLGHSMGVQVILDFAIQYPERTMGLVPMCGSYGHPLDTFHNTDIGGKILPHLRRLMSLSPSIAQKFWSKTLTTELAYQVAVNLEVNGKVLKREEFGPYFQHLAAMNVSVFLGVVAGLMDHSTESQLPSVNVPSLVVGGQHDTFTPGWLSERMVDLLPDAELLMIPGGSHVAPIEIPELLHLRLKKFIDNRVAPQLKTHQAKTKTPKVKVEKSDEASLKKSLKASEKKADKKSAKKADKEAAKSAKQFLSVWEETVEEAEVQAKQELKVESPAKKPKKDKSSKKDKSKKDKSKKRKNEKNSKKEDSAQA